MKPTERIGLECLSIFGLPPVPFIELAAELDCPFITLGVPVNYNPENYPKYSLTDAHTQREIRAALRAHDVSVKVGEGFFFMPGMDAQHFTPQLDAMAEIGAQTINMVSVNGDLAYSLDAFAELAEMSAARGMSSSVEFIAGQAIGDLESGVNAVRHVARPDFKLVIDFLHLAKSGGTVADLANVPSDLIGHIQLCDWGGKVADPFYEVMYERLSPGAGKLPLLEMLAALPRGVPVGVEIPQRSLAEAGQGPLQRLRPCVEAARALLASINSIANARD